MAPVPCANVVLSVNPHDNTCARIDYRPYLNVDHVAGLCRKVWLLDVEKAGVDEIKSPSSPTALSGIFQKIQKLSAEELEAVQSSDRESIHTPLRDAVYFTWNHVFFDISRNFELNCCHATYLPPATDVIEVKYPHKINGKEGKATQVFDAVLDCNVLLSPLYLDPDIKVWMVLGGESQPDLGLETIDADQRPVFAFDSTDGKKMYEREACWIKSDQRLQIFVSDNVGSNKSSLAGLIIRGKFTMSEGPSEDEVRKYNERKEKEQEDEDDDDEE